MKPIWFVSICLLAFAGAVHENKFDVTSGCLQHNSNYGYNVAHPFFALTSFENALHQFDDKDTINRTTIRIGILTKNDGHIRLTSGEYPFYNPNNLITEIVISGWSNTNHEVRTYSFQRPDERSGITILKHQSSLGELSEFVPLMFTMEITRLGDIALNKDGEQTSFLAVRHRQQTPLTGIYIGFCNWDVPAIYFYDCPLLKTEKHVCGDNKEVLLQH
ncbi:uncharacterized protein LOC129725673 [Wyeomyia smithii]|uniref:uncharacterized protein LOC129725673 n=1 Tax=Wyeomyia smithii TaxID=174621 RepID=UPI0024681FB3|nr:uncharacterized protein LOC129725673 [Wyeomyia smithii]